MATSHYGVIFNSIYMYHILLLAATRKHLSFLFALTPIKSRMETFWYWLIQVVLENGCFK